jgi:hypothetical protein
MRSFISGRIKLAEETGLSEQQIRTSLNKLKSTSDITIQATNRNSLITVTGWASYQDRDNKVTSQITSEPPNKQPTDNQQITTNNNVNNETSSSKDKPKGKAKRFSPPSITELITYFQEHKSSEFEANKFFDYYTSNGWQVGKTKMKDWKAAARGWISRGNQNGSHQQSNQPRKLSLAERSTNNTREALAIIEADEIGRSAMGANESDIWPQVEHSRG